MDIAATTRNATVAVQSLDGDPISKSGAVLISLGARSVPRSANQLPFYSEPVEGELTVRARKGLKLYARNRSSELGQEIPAPYEDGRYRINLKSSLRTYWLELR